VWGKEFGETGITNPAMPRAVSHGKAWLLITRSAWVIGQRNAFPTFSMGKWTGSVWISQQLEVRVCMPTSSSQLWVLPRAHRLSPRVCKQAPSCALALGCVCPQSEFVSTWEPTAGCMHNADHSPAWGLSSPCADPRESNIQCRCWAERAYLSFASKSQLNG